MTEQVPPDLPEDGQSDPESEPDLVQSPVSDQASATGVPAVDQVLAEVDRIDELPLEEHLGAYERAHTALRSALDAQPTDPA
jgi:hypothetical protein